MNLKRRHRLLAVMALILCSALAAALVLYALRQNINLFYSPSQIVVEHNLAGKKIRAGGMVVEHSLQRDPDSLKVMFTLTDFQHSVEVQYTGILPDLFREGQGVVAEGRMNDQGVFIADQVLAKHDEKYMPPEVAAALKASGKEPPKPEKEP